VTAPAAARVRELRDRLAAVVSRMPDAIREGQRVEMERFVFAISLVARACGPGARVVDVGGGWGTFSLGCATAGMKAAVIDDFRDPGFLDAPTMSAMRALHAALGVDVQARDVVAEGLGLADGAADAICCFDSMEHWHASPKPLFRSIVRALRPGGLFVLATPNCVNLRKRITVPLGRGKWSAMADWYEADVFRGHVREPDVDDLRYIARDMGLRDVRIVGRNWAGYSSPRGIVRRVTPWVDHLLRLRPSLCADLYLIGRTPGGPPAR
jgi:SAM-dependent methyltransferase